MTEDPPLDLEGLRLDATLEEPLEGPLEGLRLDAPLEEPLESPLEEAAVFAFTGFSQVSTKLAVVDVVVVVVVVSNASPVHGSAALSFRADNLRRMDGASATSSEPGTTRTRRHALAALAAVSVFFLLLTPTPTPIPTAMAATATPATASLMNFLFAMILDNLAADCVNDNKNGCIKMFFSQYVLTKKYEHDCSGVTPIPVPEIRRMGARGKAETIHRPD